MKKGLLILLSMITFTGVSFAYNYDSTVPLPGESLADSRLQTEMLFPVYAYGLRVATPDCKSFSIVDTTLSQPKMDGAWQEVWTVKACERTAKIPINFMSKQDRTDFAIDPMGVKVQK